MSQPHPLQLNYDTTLYPQYYHCVIRGIPRDMSAPQLVDYLSAKEDSETVAELSALGRRISLHQLYTYKEPLQTKFSYLGFFFQCTPEAPMDEDTKRKVHKLAKQWVNVDLKGQLASGSMSVVLAQPPECCHSHPFLDALRTSCSIASREVCADPMKIETFLLARVNFNTDGANAAFNPTWATFGESYSNGPGSFPSGATWSSVGTFSVSCLTPEEILWMKSCCAQFPPVSITNGDPSTAHVEGDALLQFLQQHLSPFVSVTK